MPATQIPKESAMAVAIKDSVGSTSSKPLSRLALGSLGGTLYLLGSLAIVFYGIPVAWETLVSRLISDAPGSAVDAALRILVMIAAAIGLWVMGRTLVGAKAPHGLRAGVAIVFLGLIAIGLLTCGLGNSLEFRFGESNPALAMGITSIVGVGLLGLAGMYLIRPGFDRIALQVEDQGWFTAAAYKRGQGLRVRRGTLLGILLLAGCGIYTLLSHDTLRTGSAHWDIVIPFTGGRVLRLLPDLQFTVPILITAATLWLANRIVNYPAFADFLIATEAELNKVSWTTRKRLIQDTIVVLVTVFLFTAYMFIVDIAWVQILRSPWIQVLQNPTQTQERQTGPLDW
ncbi:MAG TPA: preprotein translocase subunit SecE [Gemmataceae bacterium]|nr:preprotein translocase subunit SecE [Gemmataceae bacterium]